MRNRLIIEGNAVYEIDDECMKQKQEKGTASGCKSQTTVIKQGQVKNQACN